MSIRKNIQCFREWGYSNNFLIKEPIAELLIDPTLNSKERNRLKWQSKKSQLA